MKTATREEKMGRFAVEIELANYDDVAEAMRGHLAEADVRRMKVEGVVDSGAARLVLPASVAKQLGLRVSGQVKVRYADRRVARRPEVQGVFLRLLGREGIFRATVEPKRKTALIGGIVLEDLDLLVDCMKQKLYPRDPRFIVSEIE